MHNGIHSIDEIINHLAEVAIYNAGWKNNWQKYLMAEELEINVNELEVICEYLNVDFGTYNIEEDNDIWLYFDPDFDD